MSLAAALAVNLVAMLALLGGLAYVMSRPRRLDLHVPASQAEVLPVQPTAQESSERIAA